MAESNETVYFASEDSNTGLSHNINSYAECEASHLGQRQGDRRHTSQSRHPHIYTTPNSDNPSYHTYENTSRSYVGQESSLDLYVTSGRQTKREVRSSKSSTEKLIEEFTKLKCEERDAKETHIINDLLKKSDTESPILDGQLDELAMLACCDSSRVVKRALDVLLNEIFLNISDLSVDRCKNILQAEEALRSKFLEFMRVDRFKAKCHRMTTYAWLITLVLLKFDEQEFAKLKPKIKIFDQSLVTLMKQTGKNEQNLYRYGICLARESIKRILQSSPKRNVKESLLLNIAKCANLLKGKLDKDEVTKLGKELNDADSWLNIHVCLVFLQDLPKHYHFKDNPRPVILMQMLVADYRERSSSSKFKNFIRNPRSDCLFELLVYRVMLRLITTSKSKAIIEQVLTGEQGCRGVFRNWEGDKSMTSPLGEFVANLCEQLCERAVFFSTPQNIKEFLDGRCIEHLSILHLCSRYRDEIFEILQISRIQQLEQRVSIYDALMSGQKCLLKLHLHSKEEMLETKPVAAPLREEIEILDHLHAVKKPCENIVRLLGLSTDSPMHMIIERPTKGDLLTYLHGFTQPLKVDVLLHIAQDICEAMIFLGENNIIHRDLCARSCFVFDKETSGNVLVKLGDFHFATFSDSPQDKDSQNQFAVRWMAVEVLGDGEFSVASDVWSFGVLLFEIFTFGSEPYINMPDGKASDNDEDFRQHVLDGNRIELDSKIPDSIRKMIQSTMKKKDHRPTFLELKTGLKEMRFDDGTYMYPAHYRKLPRASFRVREKSDTKNT
ncbi:uncharacterized protein LOC114534205 [Dendronephthya gigantea]|uniref:uncharacterized protein LOC114534205 n=1 Tax=Dendronephthya gigantea TaxID=151771 RepID=UPI00106D19EE|nr:uncharacterized protein LOC114534205 [Dendronephthya gigantea]